MFTQQMIIHDKAVCLGIAMSFAPVDEGNLKYNAIKDELTNDGFRIKYSLADAFYIYFQEEGTTKYSGNQGFIANRTLPVCASYISAKHKQKNERMINAFEFYSSLGYLDDVKDTRRRDARHEHSLKQNVEQIAKDNKWAHDTSYEEFDKDFENKGFIHTRHIGG